MGKEDIGDSNTTIQTAMISLELTILSLEIHKIDPIANLINTAKNDHIVILLIAMMIDQNAGRVLGLLMTDIDQAINPILTNIEIDRDLEVSKDQDMNAGNIGMIDIRTMIVTEKHTENILSLGIEMISTICIGEKDLLKEEIMKKTEESSTESLKILIGYQKMIVTIRSLIDTLKMIDMGVSATINIRGLSTKNIEETVTSEEKSLLVEKR